MSVRTPSTIIELGGSPGIRQVLIRFTAVSDGDTYVSGLANLVAKHIDNTTDGVVVSATYSAGTFTFAVAGAGTNKATDVFAFIQA